MHLQENRLFDLDLGIMVKLNIAQHLLHPVTYAPVAMSYSLGKKYIFDLWLKVTWNVAQYPLYHETYRSYNADPD